MTLVLGCLTPEYVIQVSDQRVTRISDGALVDDLRNKGTMFCAQMGFAYTGLAEIEGTRTDLWLARALAEELTLQAGLSAVAARATKAFQQEQVAQVRARRHAFVGVGFCRTSPDTDLRACQIIVSNFLSRDGEWLADPNPRFEIQRVIHPESRPFILCKPVGARVPEDAFKSLRRNIRACVRRNTTPLPIMTLMANAIRSVAQFEHTVGKALLVIFIPRVAVERKPVFFMTPIAPSALNRLDTPMFLHLSANSSDPYWDSPNFVCGGMLMEGYFEQGISPTEGTPPNPGSRLDRESYRMFLLYSGHVRELVEFMETLGVKVASLGSVSRDLDMLRQAGIEIVAQVENLFRQSRSWNRQLLSEFYSTWYAEEIKQGKLSTTRSGIVSMLLVATYPQVFTPDVLVCQYGWGLPHRILSLAARHNPPAASG